MGAVRMGCVEGAGLAARIGGKGEVDHGEAVGEAGGRKAGLERLASDWGDEDAIEAKTVGGGAGDGEVAEVGRIEGATEERRSIRVHGHGRFVPRAGFPFAGLAGHLSRITCSRRMLIGLDGACFGAGVYRVGIESRV